MKKIILIFLFALNLISSSYMGKIEPLESVAIRSEVSGRVDNVSTNLSHSFVKNNNVVSINTSTLDIEISSLSSEIKNQQKVVKIQKARHKSKLKIKSISRYEKQQQELLMRQAMQVLYGLKKQLKLKQEIRAKHIFKVKNKYVGNIYVASSDFVSMGTKIMDVYDISATKIILFLESRDIEDIQNKDIYIDGKKSDFKLSYISKVTDAKYISSYRAKLISKTKTKIFGKVVEVKFK